MPIVISGVDMDLFIQGEHNFFLFQDIVSDFMGAVKGRTWAAFKSKDFGLGTVSYYAGISWTEIFIEKLLSKPTTDLWEKVHSQLIPWMITTNRAILKSQVIRKERSEFDSDYRELEKEADAFQIEISEDGESFIAHLEGEILDAFQEATHFHKESQRLEPKRIRDLFSRYYRIEPDEMEEEITMFCMFHKPGAMATRFENCYSTERINI